MSRRKQANPKPLKRKVNEEIDELVELLHLPSDVLTITESSNASITYTVFTKIPLPKGTLFGPFRGEVFKGNKSTPRTTLIEARDVDEEKIYLDLYDETGSWLRLVKLATTPYEANLVVFVEGNDVWCSVYCDIDDNVELCAWYKITPRIHSSNSKLRYPLKPSISERDCYTSVSRYKIPHLEECDKSNDFMVETRDFSINKYPINGEARFEKQSERMSPVTSEPSSDETSNGDLLVSVKNERKSPEFLNSSSDDQSSDGHSKHGKSRANVSKNSTHSNLSNSLSPLLPTRSPLTYFSFLTSPTIPTLGPSESSCSSVAEWPSGFVCEPCGITFSSQRTLQAHCQYYCSHRRNSSFDDDGNVTQVNSPKEEALSPKEEGIELFSHAERANHVECAQNYFSEDSEKQICGEDSDQQSTSSNSAEEKHARMENQNTVRKTKTDLQLVNSFLSKVGEERPLEKIPPNELDSVLASFIVNVKKRNGDEYEPDSLRGLLSSVDRYLRKQRYPVAIFSPAGESFSKTRESLRMKQLQLKSQGKGSLSTKHVPLTDFEIEKLFLSGQLGASSKDSIINTLWFYNSIFFGIRSAKRHYELRWADIVLCELPNGMEYLEYIDQETKKPKEGVMGNFRIYANLNRPDRDPIHIYRLYASHRPECMKKNDSPFYLVPNHSKATYNSSWFKRQPLGENRLASLMKCMAKKAGLSTEKHFYNITVRRALMLRLQSRM